MDRLLSVNRNKKEKNVWRTMSGSEGPSPIDKLGRRDTNQEMLNTLRIRNPVATQQMGGVSVRLDQSKDLRFLPRPEIDDIACSTATLGHTRQLFCKEGRVEYAFAQQLRARTSSEIRRIIGLQIQ